MTAFAISSGGIEYFDQKTGGSTNATQDSYTISNGSTLVVRTDTYACLNHSSAFGSVDNISYSGTGGTFLIDPTYTRYVAYTGGSGNAPAYGAAITQGGVSAVFLGVWANWQSEPIAPGAAIPASGFIKVGGVSGGIFAAGALAGISATCSGPDLQSWIEVRSCENATITVPRVGKFKTVSAWFELGVTNGVAGQVFPCPTTGVDDKHWPGTFIESAPGSGVYERYAGVGSMPASSTTPTDVRAKFVWQTTSGLVLGHDGTNVVGYLPPAGCKVRIPAAILTNSARTSGNGSGLRQLPNVLLGLRSEFATTSGGDIELDGVVCQWYLNISSAYALKILSSLISDVISVSKLTTGIYLYNTIVSCTRQQTNSALIMGQCYVAGLIEDCLFVRYSLASASLRVANISTSTDVTVKNSWAVILTARTVATGGSWGFSQCVRPLLDRCFAVGARIEVAGCRDPIVNDLAYADSLTVTLSAGAVAMQGIALSGGSGARIYGGKGIPGVVNAHPYYSWLDIAASDDVRFFNFGTPLNPFDCGTINAMGSIVASTFGTASNGIYVKRCYSINTRGNTWAFDNAQINIEIENFAGDYSDAITVNAANMRCKSVALTNTTTGQSAVYGSHWLTRFTSATAGVVEILCNEPTAKSASQCQITSGTPQFDGSGRLLMTVVGQQVIWELDYFAIGYTAFANIAPSIAGTNVTYSSGARWGNHDLEFQVDTGSGYSGTWLSLTAANLITHTISASSGFKIKIRATCAVANTSNALNNLRINMVTTTNAQNDNLYPLSVSTVQVNGLVSGSRVKATAVVGGAVLFTGPEVGGVVTFTTEYSGAIAIEARKSSASPFYLPWNSQVTPVADDTVSVTALQQLDE